MATEIICNAGPTPLTAEIVNPSSGEKAIRLEAGCNEFWLDADEASALIAYLQRAIPILTN